MPLRLSALPRPLRGSFARMLARKWLIALAAAGFGICVAYAGLTWQTGVVFVLLFTLAAALLPRKEIAGTNGKEAARLAAREIETAAASDILQALPDPAILLAANGIVVAYNRQAREQWDNLRRGNHLSSAMRQPAVLDAVTAVAGSAKPLTVTYQERVPVERRIAATVAALPAARRSGTGGPAVLVSLRDLSGQERLNQMRADFVANASHELRTPLASLLGFIETLQGPAENDARARKRFLAIMATQAERMTRLIDDLLSLSRVEMNVHLPPTDMIDLNKTVSHVTETLLPVARESGMKVDISLPSDTVNIRGDRDELVQLLQNLIENAIKYGREGGRIEVSLARQASPDKTRRRVSLSVTDNGRGIAAEHLPRLTERFYRVDVASSREKGGTGLGLAIVKHIVSRHRGELKISSVPGKGSTFTVFLDEAGVYDAESAREHDAKDMLETTGGILSN